MTGTRSWLGCRAATSGCGRDHGLNPRLRRRRIKQGSFREARTEDRRVRIRSVGIMEKVHFSRRHDDRLRSIGAGPPLILVSGASLTVRSTPPSRLRSPRTSRCSTTTAEAAAIAATPCRSRWNVRSRTSTCCSPRPAARPRWSGCRQAPHSLLKRRCAGLPIDSLVMWEPPFSVDADGQRRFEGVRRTADGRLLAEGRKADALAHFMRFVGLPDDMIDGMRQSPYWELGEASGSDLGVRRRGAGRLDCSDGAVRPDWRSDAGPCRIGESRVPPHRGRPGRGRDPRGAPRGPARPGPQRRRAKRSLWPCVQFKVERTPHR